MKIRIKYDSAWQNSFLDGSNNEPLPKKGRKYIASMSSLSKRDTNGEYPNFIKREITHDTVMGILNRLIGDQRKLYQTRASEHYWFKDLEDTVTFVDNKQLSSEVVFLKNTSGATDKNSYVGAVKTQHPAFISDYSNELWAVMKLPFDELCDFITDESYQVDKTEQFDPLKVLDLFNSADALKSVDISTNVKKVLDVLKDNFPDADYVNKKGKVNPIMVYCGAMYIQLDRLQSVYDVSSALTKSGGLSGISKRSFTKRDFMAKLSGGTKTIYGNPYLLNRKVKGEGNVTDMLTKASGVLDIDLDLPMDKANELFQLIDDAGVSAFYVGKKGLAYVDKIYC